MHRRRIPELDVTLAFGDQVKDHQPLGTGLQQWRHRVGTLRLIAPRRGKSGIDKDGADQAHHAQGLREGVHYTISMCKVIGTAFFNAAYTGEQPTPPSTSMRNRSGATSRAAIRTRNCRSRGPAWTGPPSASDIPSRPRVSERLLATTSSAVSSIPSAAAPIAMTVAAQDPRPARNNQPGETWSPLPPSSSGMSVGICLPFAWLANTLVPLCQREVAGASSS